jgi:spermidine/putrescine-binding protein
MLTSLGILYNRDVLDRLGLSDWHPPASWRDLGDERLVGWVSAGDPRMSGSVHMLYEWILQTYGWEEGFAVLMRLGANARGFARFSDAVSRDVVLGKTAAGGTLDSYAFSATTREQRAVNAGYANRNPLGFVLPKNETLLNPDSIAILKGAPHRRLAEKFIEYNLSEDGGQQLWMLRPMTDPAERQRYPGSPHRYAICRLSVMERLYDPARYPEALRSVPINPFDATRISLGGKQYDNRVADRRRRALGDLFGAWIIDPHAELHAAWRAVLRCPPAEKERLAAELFAPPLPRAEDLDNLRGLLGDPRRRAELVNAWLEQARRRYARVRAAAERGPP